jgi:hypothetical protein
MIGKRIAEYCSERTSARPAERRSDGSNTCLPAGTQRKSYRITAAGSIIIKLMTSDQPVMTISSHSAVKDFLWSFFYHGILWPLLQNEQTGVPVFPLCFLIPGDTVHQQRKDD